MVSNHIKSHQITHYHPYFWPLLGSCIIASSKVSVTVDGIPGVAKVLTSSGRAFEYYPTSLPLQGTHSLASEWPDPFTRLSRHPCSCTFPGDLVCRKEERGQTRGDRQPWPWLRWKCLGDSEWRSSPSNCFSTPPLKKNVTCVYFSVSVQHVGKVSMSI
jgi:hypothetical protein